MTKSELRRARKDAVANGKPLTGDLAIGPIAPFDPFAPAKPAPIKRRASRRNYAYRGYASRAEQDARYIDCGPNNWDDRDSPSGDY
jgi:hypothetical protein